VTFWQLLVKWQAVAAIKGPETMLPPALRGVPSYRERLVSKAAPGSPDERIIALIRIDEEADSPFLRRGCGR